MIVSSAGVPLAAFTAPRSVVQSKLNSSGAVLGVQPGGLIVSPKLVTRKVSAEAGAAPARLAAAASVATRSFIYWRP